MQYGDYPTPGDVKIYIAGHWVDDAYRVDFDEQNQKIALRGYHQKYYAYVADGFRVVVGNIIIHYRYPGYLLGAVQSVMKKREDDIREQSAVTGTTTQGAQRLPGTAPETSSQQAIPQKKRAPTRSNLEASLNKLKNMSISERIEYLANSYKEGYFQQSSAMLNALFTDDAYRAEHGVGSRQIRSVVDMDPSQFQGGHQGFDMDLYYGYYGNPSQGVFVSETLKGVHFTGRRKIINASTSGGDLSGSGQSILEVYPFFAREAFSTVYANPPSYVTS